MASYPKLLALCKDKHIKLYLGPCKVIMTLRGTFCLVSPIFGSGFYGSFRSNGDFLPSKECKPEFIELLDRVEAEGLKAVAEIGILTGNCGICGKMLTNEESIASGIGPICAGKVGYSPVPVSAETIF